MNKRLSKKIVELLLGSFLCVLLFFCIRGTALAEDYETVDLSTQTSDIPTTELSKSLHFIYGNDYASTFRIQDLTTREGTDTTNPPEASGHEYFLEYSRVGLVIEGYKCVKITYEYSYNSTTPSQSLLTINRYYTDARSSSPEAEQTDNIQPSVPAYTPPTPEEVYNEQLKERFPLGEAFLDLGTTDAFAYVWPDGTTISITYKGNSIGSFSITDKTGNPCTLTFYGGKTIGGKNYLYATAWSKLKGYELNVGSDSISKLKAAGISGIALSTGELFDFDNMSNFQPTATASTMK